VRGSTWPRLRLIWHAAIWKIWQARNDFIFNNTTKGVKEIVEEVKVIYWRWILGRTNTNGIGT
jgi:hypothetical protein